MSKEKPHGFATRAIHAGQPPDPTTGAIMTPDLSNVRPTSSRVPAFIRDLTTPDPSIRPGSPTNAASPIWSNGARGFAFASGLAGMATVLELLDSGAHVIASDDLVRRHVPAVRTRPEKIG